MKNKMKRREFLLTLAGGAAWAVLSRCAPATPLEEPTMSAGAVPVVPPATSPSESAPTVQAQKLMRNENRPGFYIRYIKALAPVDVETWTLKIEGKVMHPQTLTFEDIKALPEYTQKSRLKCVEGWSVAAEWLGFLPQVLVDMVVPQSGAKWVHFHCADDYYESLSLEDFVRERVMLAYGMNDNLLLPEYGAPLRLIVPFKYGYKGPKAIQRIVFSDEELRGYWSTVGPYSTEGDIKPGYDYALDLGTKGQVNSRGELFYEEGLESQED